MKATNEFVWQTSEEYENLEKKYINKKVKVQKQQAIIKKHEQKIKELK